MKEVTVTYSHNYEKDKIDALESDPNVEIISRNTVVGDTIHLLPLHLEPNPAYLMYNTTYTYRIIPDIQSPRQDATSAVKAGQGPKTRGDTDEFISAFWVNGKPKCRMGYTYDFRRKMCRRI
jgi:hypothetical protein